MLKTLNYDALGRTVSMTDGIGATNWAFDASGRAQSEDGPFANDTVTYGYDSLSRLSGRSVQRDANTADVTNIGYDNLGRLSAVAQTNGAWGAVNGARGATWNWTYQGDTGKPLSKDAPNGTHTDYAYETGNTLQRLIGVSNKASAGGAVLSQFSYAYGSTNAPGFRDNRVAASKQYGAVAANAQTTNYGYNQTSMLTGESAPAKTADLPALSQSYAFDAMGNRTQWSDGVAKTLTNAVYNRLNQLTGTSNYNNTTPASPVLLSTSAFGYDGDGNMTDVATTTGTTTTNGVYRYDDASRLVAIETPGQSKTEFFYDGMSRLRVSRTWVWQGGAWVPQLEKRRVYVGMDVVQERDGANSVTASYTRVSNTGGMLARTNSTGSSFYGYDSKGNVTTLTDSSGSQVGSYTYDGWGNTVASSGAKAGENPYRFSTKEAISGLYSYGFRFYSPGLGRWINRDPIREKGGGNIYAFVGNNPVNHSDARGLCSSCKTEKRVTHQRYPLWLSGGGSTFYHHSHDMFDNDQLNPGGYVTNEEGGGPMTGYQAHGDFDMRGDIMDPTFRYPVEMNPFDSDYPMEPMEDLPSGLPQWHLPNGSPPGSVGRPTQLPDGFEGGPENPIYDNAVNPGADTYSYIAEDSVIVLVVLVCLL